MVAVLGFMPLLSRYFESVLVALKWRDRAVYGNSRWVYMRRDAYALWYVRCCHDP